MQAGFDPATCLAVFRRFDQCPHRDMAFETRLLERVARDGGAAMFAYGWRDPVLVLGRGQSEDSIDKAAATRLGVPVVRRCSGGTAVVHRGDLALSLVLSHDHPWAQGPIRALYDRFLGILMDHLGNGIQPIGLDRPAASGARAPAPRSPICFEGDSGETLSIRGRKAVGCAQARRRGAVLVHGMLLLDLDADLQAALFGVPRRRILDAMAPLPTCVGDRQALAARIIDGTATALSLRPVFLSPPGLDPGTLEPV